jgi:hypothetical protein
MSPYDQIPTRRKVTCVALLASAFALALVFVAFLAYRAVSIEERSLNNLSRAAATLAIKAQAPLATSDLAALQKTLSLCKSNPDIIAACIYNRNGTAIAKFVCDGSTDFPFPMPEMDTHRFEKRLLVMFHPIDANGQLIGNVFLCSQVSSMLVGLPHRTAILAAIASMLFISAIGFALWLQRLAARSIQVPDLIPLVPTNEEPGDDLRELTRKVDAISTRLETVEHHIIKQGTQPKPQPRKPKAAVEKPIEPPKEPLTFSSLDLNTVTKKVIEEMREEIQSRNADVAIQSNLPLVLANTEVIEQVLRNLISNALKFCPENSKPRIRVGGCVNGNSVRLWIHDNGVGIAPDKHPTIFTATDRTSAGLALVKQGVEQMRGQVGFDSAAGQGSTFWIELPKSQAATLN